MWLFKEIISIAYKNYFAYLFVVFFASACILSERLFLKNSFKYKEKFAFYFITTIINLGFSYVSADIYSVFNEKIKKSMFIVVMIAISFLMGLFISFLLKKFINLFNNKSLLLFLQENIMGIGSFIILIVRYVITVPTAVDSWHSWCYAIDFSMGCSSRFLAGQILSLFCKDYVSERDIFIYCFIVGLILITLTSILINIVVKKADKKTKPAVFFISACFVACPANIISLFSEANFGKIEIFGLILSLFAVYIFNKIKNITLRYGIITFLSILSIVFYQGYVFLYYNLILTVMIFDIFEEKRINKNKLIYGIISVLFSFVTFIKFQLFNKTIFNSAEEMIAELSQRTDIKISEEPIKLEYFSGLKESYQLVTSYLDGFAREKILLHIVLFIPLIYFVLGVVFYFFHTGKQIYANQKLLQTRNILSFSTIFLVVPQFVLNVDWGRWMISLCVFVFFYIMYYSFKDDYSMKLTLEKTASIIKQKPHIATLILIYIAFFSTVNSVAFTDADKLFDYIRYVFSAVI